jgi:hypothetical protein
MRNLMLVVFALVLVVAMTNVGMAQSSSSSGEVAQATVLGAGILNTPTAPLDFGTVVGGYTYVWDVSSSTGLEEVRDGDAGSLIAAPPAGFAQGAGVAEWDITTTSTGNLDAVTITFALPSYLKGTGANGLGVGGKLPISFNATSAYVGLVGQTAGPALGLAGNAFDPNSPYTTSIDGTNGTGIYLGGALTVPGNATDDIYVATIICTAAISGL